MATASESRARNRLLPVPECYVVAWPHYEADLDQPFQGVIQGLPNRKHLTEFLVSVRKQSWCSRGRGGCGVDLEGLVLGVSRCGAADLILLFEIKDAYP